jgi:hypothetical protein
VRAQFDALVVNLHDDRGIRRSRPSVFSLVDARTWYVLANYRETELKHIAGWRRSLRADRPPLPLPRHRAGSAGA